MEANLRDAVRSRYAQAATAVTRENRPRSDDDSDRGRACCTAGCCAPSALDGSFGRALYATEDLLSLPAAAVEASLGCGNPAVLAELRPGERVLDLGSGGGIDVLLAAGRVGPSGYVYGLDMTDEMIELARRNAFRAGATNVRFIKGLIEAIPLPDESVDVVISNCVINLSTDKPSALTEIGRVLRPGGRIAISDVIAADTLTPAQRAERGSYVGCIAGALSFGEYARGLGEAGLSGVEITPTHEVADQMFAALVRAVRPTEARADRAVEITPTA